MKRFTYDDISVVGRVGAPSVLITVRSVENPPFLRRPQSWEKDRGSREGPWNVRKLEDLLVPGQPSGLLSAHSGDVCERAVPTRSVKNTLPFRW